MLTIERQESGVATVLRLRGELGGADAGEMRAAMTKCIRDGRCHVVMDVARLEFMDRLGAAVLLDLLGELRAVGGDLILVGLNLYCRRLLQQMALCQVFECLDSEPAALRRYQQEAA